MSLDTLLEIHACYLNYIAFHLMLSPFLGGFDLLFAQTVIDWFIGKNLWSVVCTLVPGIDWSIPAWAIASWMGAAKDISIYH